LKHFFLQCFYRIPKKVWDNPQYYNYSDAYWGLMDTQHALVYVCSGASPSQYTQETGLNYVSDCSFYDDWIVEDATRNNWCHVFYEYPNAMSEWDTGDVRLLKREDGGNISFADDFITHGDMPGQGGLPGDCEIEPQPWMVTASQEDLETGVPFAVYYRWQTGMNPPWSPLQTPPPPEVPHGDPEWDHVGWPKLNVDLCDVLDHHLEYWNFNKMCHSENVQSCDVIDTGVSIFSCDRDFDIINADVVGIDLCNNRFEEHAFSDLPAHMSSIVVTDAEVIGEDDHGGSEAKHTAGCLAVSSAQGKLLRDPLIGGDDTTSNEDP
jgi:hypothetical protein